MYTAHETILSYMTLSENKGQVGYPVLHEGLKLSWYKLFKKTKESFVRKWVYVGEGGIVAYPNTLERLQGIYTVDECGDLAGLFEDTQKNIIPKLKAKCTCTSCDIDDCMCPSIQDSIIQTEVLINSIPYSNKVHTRVLKNGNVIEEKFTWAPVFNGSGTFVRAEEVKSQSIRCHVECKPCGCPVNSDENRRLLSGCGCIIDCDPANRESYPALDNNFGYYKSDDDNKQIHLFNSHGKKSRLTQVLLSYQSNGSDMIVPDYAIRALLAELDHVRKMFSPSFNRGDRDEAKRNAYREKMDMLKDLNPIPYEFAVQVSDATKKHPYYRGVHSDFVHNEHSHASIAPVCQSPQTIQYITNVTNNIVSSRWLRVVVDESGGPVAGLPTYQNNLLKGLGGALGQITILVSAFNMQSWGDAKSFDYDKDLGTITFTQGYVWQTGGSLEVDLNQ